MKILCIFGVVAPEDQHPGTSETLRFASPKGLVFLRFFFFFLRQRGFIYPAPLLVCLLPPSLFLEDGERKEKRTILDLFFFFFSGKEDFVQLKKEE